MFFDDEDLENALFGDRELLQQQEQQQQLQQKQQQQHQQHQQQKQNPRELNFHKGQMVSFVRNPPNKPHHLQMNPNSISIIQDMELANPNPKEGTYVGAYCSDSAIHSVLDSTSMSYQNQKPASTRYNLDSTEKIEIYSAVTSMAQIKRPVSPESRTQRIISLQTQWEIINSVYCTHQGLDTILETSSLSYHTTNPQNNYPFHLDTPNRDSYDDDDEYFLAFGRTIKDIQKNPWVEEPNHAEMHLSCDAMNGPDDPPYLVDFPLPPKVYLEGMDDFDVFTLFPISDEAM